MSDALTGIFGIEPQSYPIVRGSGELKLVNRVAALAWQHVFGFNGVDSLTKRIPDLGLQRQRRAALANSCAATSWEMAALQPGTLSSARRRAISPAVLSYLLATFGVVAAINEIDARGCARRCGDQVFKTTHRHWQVVVAATEDLARLRLVWSDHAGASTIEEKVGEGRPCPRRGASTLSMAI